VLLSDAHPGAGRASARPLAKEMAAADYGAFERAVLTSFDQGANHQLRREANASLDGLKHSEDGWRYCFQAFGACETPQVKFWCLQTLVALVSESNGERYVGLPEPSKAEIRANLITWVQVRSTRAVAQPTSQPSPATLRVTSPPTCPP
jgi:hypothetical protein